MRAGLPDVPGDAFRIGNGTACVNQPAFAQQAMLGAGLSWHAKWLPGLSDRDGPDPDDAWVQKKDEVTKEEDDDAEESDKPKAKKA